MRRFVLTLAAVSILLCGLSGTAIGAGSPKGGGLLLKKIGNFEAPAYITGAPGSPHLLFVVEEGGRVVLLRDGKKLPTPFLDISDRVLSPYFFSIAFPPDYAASGRFYVDYVNRHGDVEVDEFRRDTPAQADEASRRTVIKINFPPEPPSTLIHYGGQLAFAGRFLYISVGDGSRGGDPSGNAQNLDSLKGKILRIDPRPHNGHHHGAPSSNPFFTHHRKEIFSYGLRNPWRFSIEPVPGGPDRILIGDVGENRFEELDYTTIPAARGANFGWPIFEGTELYSCDMLCPGGGRPDPGGTTAPIFTYRQWVAGGEHGACAIMGGYIDRDPELPALAGRYVYGDLCDGQIRSLIPRLDGARDDRPTGLVSPQGTSGYRQLDSFGEDEAGHIYVVSQPGAIYRIVQRSPSG